MTPLMYKGYSVVFQEVPGEVSLAINISGCQHHCPDCHSKYLWNDEGAAFLRRDLGSIIDEYDGLITCVCFMGGDHNLVELNYHAKKMSDDSKLAYILVMISMKSNIKMVLHP